jgi:hypothetical protein
VRVFVSQSVRKALVLNVGEAAYGTVLLKPALGKIGKIKMERDDEGGE